MANLSVLLSTTLAFYLLFAGAKLAIATYPPNFFNQSGCLYSYLEGGNYSIHFHDSEPMFGDLSRVTYDKVNSNCTNGLYPGKLAIVFSVADNNMESMTLNLVIKPSPSEGYWEVNSAILQISPLENAKERFKNLTIELKSTNIYAGQHHSFSCGSLVLKNSLQTTEDPNFRIKLDRLQIQPFAELANTVFAPSFDCSVWLTLPVIMGFLLMLFIIFTVMIGVNLILAQGNQTSEIRYSKQGGMLMNQAQLDATKG